MTETYQFFFSEAGREEMRTEIRQYQQKFGAKWLDEFKKDFPDLVTLIDLIANHDAPAAFESMKTFVTESKEFDSSFKSPLLRLGAKLTAITFLELNKATLFELHSEIKAEIDRKQF